MLCDDCLHADICENATQGNCDWYLSSNKLNEICEIARKSEKKLFELGQRIGKLKTRVTTLESQVVKLRQRYDLLHDNLTVKMEEGEGNEG